MFVAGLGCCFYSIYVGQDDHRAEDGGGGEDAATLGPSSSNAAGAPDLPDQQKNRRFAKKIGCEFQIPSAFFGRAALSARDQALRAREARGGRMATPTAAAAKPAATAATLGKTMAAV